MKFKPLHVGHDFNGFTRFTTTILGTYLISLYLPLLLLPPFGLSLRPSAFVSLA